MTRAPIEMADPLRQLNHWEGFLLRAVEDVRWEPLTVLFVLASAWWVKGPLFVAVGAACDIRSRRRAPLVASATAVGVFIAGALSFVLKQTFDRIRPPAAEIGVDPLVATPLDPSFPSGHTMTAFAAAAVVASFHPRLRVPLFALAATVGLSRIYLGVHFGLDVLAGALFGIAVGLFAAWIARTQPWRLLRRTGGASPRSSRAMTGPLRPSYSRASSGTSTSS